MDQLFDVLLDLKAQKQSCFTRSSESDSQVVSERVGAGYLKDVRVSLAGDCRLLAGMTVGPVGNQSWVCISQLKPGYASSPALTSSRKSSRLRYDVSVSFLLLLRSPNVSG